jgi:hypothetical protein
MLSFIMIFALGVSALLVAQHLDIECLSPPKRHFPKHSLKISARIPAESVT